MHVCLGRPAGNNMGHASAGRCGGAVRWNLAGAGLPRRCLPLLDCAHLSSLWFRVAPIATRCCPTFCSTCPRVFFRSRRSSRRMVPDVRAEQQQHVVVVVVAATQHKTFVVFNFSIEGTNSVAIYWTDVSGVVTTRWGGAHGDVLGRTSFCCHSAGLFWWAIRTVPCVGPQSSAHGGGQYLSASDSL